MIFDMTVLCVGDTIFKRYIFILDAAKLSEGISSLVLLFSLIGY